jgi:nucleotide-binding universal stress UspA family protein
VLRRSRNPGRCSSNSTHHRERPSHERHIDPYALSSGAPLGDRFGVEPPRSGPTYRPALSSQDCSPVPGIAYRHLLVAYDGTSEGDEAIVAADLLAQQDRSRLTIVVVVELERPFRWVTRWPRGTSVWNDVLLDRARGDLKRAARLLEAPADFTVLFGPPRRAIPDGAKEFDCDAIMLPPRPRRLLGRLISRDQAPAIRRRASCEVLQPR